MSLRDTLKHYEESLRLKNKSPIKHGKEKVITSTLRSSSKRTMGKRKIPGVQIGPTSGGEVQFKERTVVEHSSSPHKGSKLAHYAGDRHYYQNNGRLSYESQ